MTLTTLVKPLSPAGHGAFNTAAGRLRLLNATLVNGQTPGQYPVRPVRTGIERPSKKRRLSNDPCSFTPFQLPTPPPSTSASSPTSSDQDIPYTSTPAERSKPHSLLEVGSLMLRQAAPPTKRLKQSPDVRSKSPRNLDHRRRRSAALGPSMAGPLRDARLREERYREESDTSFRILTSGLVYNSLP